VIMRPRLRVVLLAAVAAAAIFAAVGDATTAATAPTNTAPPTISGSTTEGSTLTTTSGSWSGTTPISFSYKWERCDTSGNGCVAIAGANSQTYRLANADVGHTVRSDVTAKNSGGSATANSSHTATIAAAPAPTNTALPTVTGSSTVGSTLTTSHGTWSGATPISYSYQWRRCDSSGTSCGSISGATATTYVVTNGDTGHTLRTIVTATNAGGQGQATSPATAVVSVSAPANTAAPAISGTTTQGQTLSVSNGTWTGGTPITYTFQWERCDGAGNNCAAVSGATHRSYGLGAADVGHKIRALVSARNSAGTNRMYSNIVGPVASNSTLPPGAVKLPNGEISVPAASIPDTDRLVISSVTYSPKTIVGRASVTATFKVTDSNKYVISGALVYVLGLPRSWAAKTAETPTGQDGTVQIQITPTTSAPRKGALVLFVRARTPQGNLLAGSSTRRLVQVRILP